MGEFLSPFLLNPKMSEMENGEIISFFLSSKVMSIGIFFTLPLFVVKYFGIYAEKLSIYICSDISLFAFSLEFNSILILFRFTIEIFLMCNLYRGRSLKISLPTFIRGYFSLLLVVFSTNTINGPGSVLEYLLMKIFTLIEELISRCC